MGGSRSSVSRREVATLLKQRRGIVLDVSLRGERQDGAVRLAPPPLGDVAHDPLVVPWPLPDQSVLTAVVTHVVEYVAPRDLWAWFGELHRVCRPGAKVYLSGPYGGEEAWGWLADPLHLTRITSAALEHLDPRVPRYQHYRPAPFHVRTFTRVPGADGVAYNAILEVQPWAS